MITEQQRIERRGYIGGSDAAAIVGVSPYRTAIELWQEKTGQVEPGNDTPSEPAEWGNILENVVAKEYSRRTGLKIARVNQTRQHAAHDWMRANLDRRVIGKPEIVEIKTVRGLGDEPRPDHLLQVRHYMAVTDTERAHLVYLIAGQRLQSFVIERDMQAEELLIKAEAEFWRHVQDKTPPAVQRITDLRLLHPQDNGQAITVDCDTAYALKQLRTYRAKREEIEAEISRHEAIIQEAMGDAAALVSETGQTVVTWKTSKPSEVIDTRRLKEEQPELAARYLTTRAGSRRFVVKDAPA
jgi:putative phage-type endonuclease